MKSLLFIFILFIVNTCSIAPTYYIEPIVGEKNCFTYSPNNKFCISSATAELILDTPIYNIKKDFILDSKVPLTISHMVVIDISDSIVTLSDNVKSLKNIYLKTKLSIGDYIWVIHPGIILNESYIIEYAN